MVYLFKRERERENVPIHFLSPEVARSRLHKILPSPRMFPNLLQAQPIKLKHTHTHTLREKKTTSSSIDVCCDLNGERLDAIISRPDSDQLVPINFHGDGLVQLIAFIKNRLILNG